MEGDGGAGGARGRRRHWKEREGERVERDRVGEKKEKRGGPLVSADMRTPHRHVSKTAQKIAQWCVLPGFV